MGVTDMTKYADIIDRLEKATGRNRDIDVAIAAAAIPKSAGSWIDQDHPWCNDHPEDEEAPEFTASIDAAIALVERMLPEANCYGVEKEPKCWTGYVSRNCVSDGHWLKEASAPTAPAALLIALFRALEAKEGG
jgi:hypothetical protein